MKTNRFRAWIKIGSPFHMNHLSGFTYIGRNEKQIQLFFEHDKGYWVGPAENVVLMQCTDVADKNGNEIYEGDINRETVETDEGGRYLYFICTWIKEWSRFAWLERLEYKSYQLGLFGEETFDKFMQETYGVFADENDKYCVCGNVYQNPKLTEPDYD